jgi:hypothetical protein
MVSTSINCLKVCLKSTKHSSYNSSSQLGKPIYSFRRIHYANLKIILNVQRGTEGCSSNYYVKQYFVTSGLSPNGKMEWYLQRHHRWPSLSITGNQTSFRRLPILKCLHQQSKCFIASICPIKKLISSFLMEPTILKIR